ncbi:hypothetical protein D3C86_1591560 [compost metagenome]
MKTPFTGRVPPAVPTPPAVPAPAPADRVLVRRRGNKLERWEIALIKAMVADGRWPNDQDILAYFTRPSRLSSARCPTKEAPGGCPPAGLTFGTTSLRRCARNAALTSPMLALAFFSLTCSG